ncbi:MAG: VWA domain-containing protein [Clostridia bacterium]|nr:MAG: VWA domain-containing protein [Clostridia bacterium]
MEQAMVQIVRILRQVGVGVSPAEVLDCLRSLELIDLSRKEDFFSAVEATLAKSPEQDTVVRSLLVHLLEPGSNGPAGLVTPAGRLPAGPAAAKERAEAHDGRGLGHSGAGGPGDEDFAAVVARGDMAAGYDFVARTTAAMPLGTEDLADIPGLVRRVQIALNWFMTEYEWEHKYQQGELSPSELQRYRERLDHLSLVIEDEIERNISRRFGRSGLLAVLQNKNLAAKDFQLLSTHEVKTVERQIYRLCRRLATRRGRRYRASARGQVDLRRTAAQAGSTGGIPLRLAHRNHRPGRPELLLLCDVSNSVARFSKFMLQLTYSLQRRFSRVRSFVFVDDLAEVTPYFQRHPLPRALELVEKETCFSRSGFSDFGRVFQAFARDYLHLLSPRTTLIVLGDARNNWRPPGEEHWQQITGRCRRTYWLNPCPRDTWGREDSLMPLYAMRCHQVYECRNLNQLARVARRIW